MVKRFIVFELLVALTFLPTALALVMGFKSLIFLPPIAVAWIALFHVFIGKKKARRCELVGLINAIFEDKKEKQ